MHIAAVELVVLTAESVAVTDDTLRVPNKTPLCLDSRFRGNDETLSCPRRRALGSSAWGIDPVWLGVLSVDLS